MANGFKGPVKEWVAELGDLNSTFCPGRGCWNVLGCGLPIRKIQKGEVEGTKSEIRDQMLYIVKRTTRIRSLMEGKGKLGRTAEAPIRQKVSFKWMSDTESTHSWLPGQCQVRIFLLLYFFSFLVLQPWKSQKSGWQDGRKRIEAVDGKSPKKAATPACPNLRLPFGAWPNLVGG